MDYFVALFCSFCWNFYSYYFFNFGIDKKSEKRNNSDKIKFKIRFKIYTGSYCYRNPHTFSNGYQAFR